MEKIATFVYGDKYLPDLVKLAVTVGTGAKCSHLVVYIMVLIIIIE